MENEYIEFWRRLIADFPKLIQEKAYIFLNFERCTLLAEPMNKITLSDPWKTALPGLLATAVYGLGFAFPQSFWGLHYPSFLPSGLNYLVFFLALAFAAWPLAKVSEWGFLQNPLSKPLKLLLMASVAALYGWMFTEFTIASHCYGDALYIYENLNGTVKTWNSDMVAVIIRPSFLDIKGGTNAYYGLVSMVSYFSSVNVTVSALWVHTACGMVFVFLWLSFSDYLFKNGSAKILFAMLGLGAPFLQVYFGHFEVYSVPIMLNLAYLYALVIAFKTRKRSRFIVAAVVAYFALKFHFSNLILLPSLAMAALHVFAKVDQSSHLLTWKRVFIAVVIPICLLGGIFYYFITQSAFGPRQFTSDTLETVIFLPIRAMENPPYDHYNLFSAVHFFDAFNLLFLLSAGGLVLMAVAWWRRPAGIDGSSPMMVVTGTTLGLYLMAFFVFNPLMSMPLDWDLMSIPAPAMLIFSAVLWRRVSDSRIFFKLLGPVLGLMLLGMTGWWVNANPAALSQRLEQTGYHSFRTYRIGISTTFGNALDLEADSSQVPIRLQAMLDRLEPDAVPTFDIEYAALLNRMALLQKNQLQAPRKALDYYDQSIKYWPWDQDVVYNTVIAHFMNKNYDRAATHLPALVRIKAPDHRKALRIAIHVSLEAAQYTEAEEYCRQLLEVVPEDDFIRGVYEMLKKGENLEELKFRFNRGG